MKLGYSPYHDNESRDKIITLSQRSRSQAMFSSKSLSAHKFAVNGGIVMELSIVAYHIKKMRAVCKTHDLRSKVKFTGNVSFKVLSSR